MNLYNGIVKDRGVMAWSTALKNPVSSLTHKKMFEYFHTDAENFYFQRMVLADVLMAVNLESVHKGELSKNIFLDFVGKVGLVSGNSRYHVSSILTHSRTCNSFLVTQFFRQILFSHFVSEIMLPWIQCALTQDCIIPIGAQSVGCRFDKRPQYRYSGCHGYDQSALNIVLSLR